MEKEELEKIKEELIAQIDSWQASDEQKEAAKEQFEDMPDDKFEEFLIKNNVVKRDKSECPFCMISEGKISSFKIDETKEAIAVLEINPLSKGHVLVIPKKHQEGKPPEDVSKFAGQIAEKLKILNPKEVKTYANQIQGHTIINVVPDYGEKQERKKAEKKELEEVQNILSEKKEVKEEKKEEKKEVKEEKLPIIKRRIP